MIILSNLNQRYSETNDQITFSEDKIDDNFEIELPLEVPIAEEISVHRIQIIIKVRTTVNRFREPKMRNYLNKYSDLVKFLDVPTRWSSLSTMITRFLDEKENLNKASIDA
ncbi:MAG: hypothetical protein MHPSP_004915, partial [Paramarteilia canceri]